MSGQIAIRLLFETAVLCDAESDTEAFSRVELYTSGDTFEGMLTKAVIALLIVLATASMGAGYFIGSGSRQTVTSTATMLSTTTTTVAYGSNTTAAFAESSNGLNLSLSLFQTNIPSRSEVGYSASIFNTLSIENNVTAETDWALPSLVATACSPTISAPIAVTVVQGYYVSSNISEAKVVYGDMCTTALGGSFSFSFAPMSNIVTYSNGECTPNPCHGRLVNQGYLAGHWNDGTFYNFTFGTYTVVASDEWGQFVILHFVVDNAIPSNST